MELDRLRREICFEAARLMSTRKETNYTQAKWRAARALTRSYIPPEALPTDFEIRQSLQQLVAADGEIKADADSNAENRRFHFFLSLLLPLDRVRQDPHYHPEGDVLYHSLQVFELARNALPYDEEFLLAALLHDIGKGIDPTDHVPAALEALEGFITPRTVWLIEHHMEAHGIHDGTIGQRAHRRLRENESYEELVLLAECDYSGRQVGVAVADVDEVLDYLRELAQMCS